MIKPLRERESQGGDPRDCRRVVTQSPPVYWRALANDSRAKNVLARGSVVAAPRHRKCNVAALVRAAAPPPNDSMTMSHNNHDTSLQDFVDKMPKVELHAHLNGCIREETLFELAKERNVKLSDHHFCQSTTFASPEISSMYNVRPRSLQDCFDMFAEIPKCVNDLVSLKRITREALEDFSSHHVVYLELRSTPKRLLQSFQSNNNEELCSKKEYIETVVSVLLSFERQEQARYERERMDNPNSCRLPLVPRFIVSVDRSAPVDDAIEHVNLAVDMMKSKNVYVVGVDLGGNPSKVSGAVVVILEEVLLDSLSLTCMLE